MSRWAAYLAALQPEMLCEVGRNSLASAGSGIWDGATVVTSRSAIEARILATDRLVPLTVRERVAPQVGLPYHWGPNGLSTGDAANELTSAVLDPSVYIQESKAATCDIRPGRRPRGPALLDYVEESRRRANAIDGSDR